MICSVVMIYEELLSEVLSKTTAAKYYWATVPAPARSTQKTISKRRTRYPGTIK
jgi:hypothetical protein